MFDKISFSDHHVLGCFLLLFFHKGNSTINQVCVRVGASGGGEWGGASGPEPGWHGGGGGIGFHHFYPTNK